eukprot:SAG31_NODE_9009_length_1349_cov_0.922400_1_plen_392_part_10
MEQLLAMGFSAESSQAALARSGHDVQRAVADLMDGGDAAQTREQQQQQQQRDSVGGQLRRWFSGLLAESSPLGPVCLLTSSHGGRSAIATRGQLYEVPKSAQLPSGGRGQGLMVASVEVGQFFTFDGDITVGAAVRLRDDPALALEVDWRKYEVGTRVSLWASGDPSHRQWAHRFKLNDDHTLSPIGHRVGPAVPPGFVLGVADGGLILVVQDDLARRIIFRSAHQMAARLDELEQQRRAASAQLEEQAAAICTSELKSQLRKDGFVRIPGAISPALLRRARQEINRALGASSNTADVFKAKTFASSPAVTDLFNRSVLPLVCRALLGDGKYEQQAGQLALRFPGDMCEARDTADHGSCECSPEHFAQVRANWHIDGLPNDFIPGKTDHYGT